MATLTLTDTMIPTRILIISDTHGKLPYPVSHPDVSQYPFHDPLPTADVLIHCGDLTMSGRIAEHHSALVLLKCIPADLKIVIPGNHDLTLDRKYYAQYPTKHARGPAYDASTLDDIQDLYTGDEARRAGIHYLIEGVAEFVLKNGANLRVYASAYQPEFYNWAFGYPRTQDRYNDPHSSQTPLQPKRQHASSNPKIPVQNHGSVDVMITHGPPKGILDLNWNARLSRADDNVGCEHLRTAVERCKPRLHCFGHIHEAWGAVRKKWDVDCWEEDFGTIDRGVQNLKVGGGQGSGKVKEEIMPPYHPTTNPSAYYMAASQGQTHQSGPGEKLIAPGDYAETQVPEMCARVDARDLEFGKETLFVNASVMNLRYQPRNAPWLVDLMLPAAARGGERDGKGSLGKEEGGGDGKEKEKER